MQCINMSLHAIDIYQTMHGIHLVIQRAAVFVWSIIRIYVHIGSGRNFIYSTTETDFIADCFCKIDVIRMT